LPSAELSVLRLSAFVDHLKEASPVGTRDELVACIGG
jgi:hypothetical protein